MGDFVNLPASSADASRRVPEHLAIILDGNGRWATKRGKPRSFGHIAGARTLIRALGWFAARGIRHVTVYAFSTENWKRPAREVASLMRLFSTLLRHNLDILVKNKIRLRISGRRGDLPPKIQKAIAEAERLTAGFDRQLIVCVSYGGRAEIIDAVNAAVARGEKVTEESFQKLLYVPDVPDPDLVIRTGGEKRTSNFLLWESAYAEYCFIDALWPDFSERDLDDALSDYASRNRRKGGIA